MTKKNIVGAAMVSACLAGFVAQPAQAASLYWDANGDGTDSTYGGTGTWDGVNTVWNTSPTIGSGSLQAWSSSSDSAVFLRGTSGTVTVSGTQTMAGLTLGGSSGSFTSGSGSYTLNSGVLDIRAASFAFAINSNAGSHTINSDVYLLGGIAAGGSTQRFNLNATMTINGQVRDSSGVSGTHNLQLEGYGTNTYSLNGDITKSTGSTGLTLSAGGSGTSNSVTYVLGGSNSGLAGVVTMNRGTLILNNSNALSGASSMTVANANTGTGSGLPDTAEVLIGTAGVTINKAITFSSLGTDTSDIRSLGSNLSSGTATYSGTITLGAFAASGTGSALRLRVDTGGTTVYSGLFNDGANTTGLTKTNGGIAKLTRSAGNTYDGTTTVSAGSLLVNNTTGSGTGTGAVSVSNNATLGGTGVISGAITVAAGGRISPGDMDTAGISSADSLDGSSLTWNSNSSTAGMLFDLGTSSDLLTLSGALTKGTGTSFLFDLEDAGGLASGTYTLINFGSTDFTLSDFAFTSSLSGLSGNFILNSSNLQFQVTAVPEPSTLGLAGAGLLALWVLRRAKREQA